MAEVQEVELRVLRLLGFQDDLHLGAVARDERRCLLHDEVKTVVAWLDEERERAER